MHLSVQLRVRALQGNGVGGWYRYGCQDGGNCVSFLSRRKAVTERFILFLMILRSAMSVRATAVGRGAERDAVLAGDPKGLVYDVMID